MGNDTSSDAGHDHILPQMNQKGTKYVDKMINAVKSTALDIKQNMQTKYALNDTNGQLQIKRYPFNIKEEEWIPVELINKSQPTDDCKDEKIDDCKDSMQYNYNKQICNIGRLKMEYKNKTIHSVGTGSIIHHSLNKSFILTAAHNIVIGDDENESTYPDSIWFEVNDNALNGYKTVRRYNCIQYHIHPQYIQYIKGAKEMNNFFDIAIVEIINTQKIQKRIKPFKIRSFKSKMDCSKIKIVGFNEEKSVCGQLDGMQGTPIFSKRCTKIRYKDIDTFHVQDGSPIFKVSTYTDIIYESFEEIIGVHTIADRIGGYNYGTLINDNILTWIHTVIHGDCVEYNDYDCYALLITPSKSKYSKCLNKIHKKFKKTEAINTIRLYYDHDIEEKQKCQNKQQILQQLATADISSGPPPYIQQINYDQQQRLPPKNNQAPNCKFYASMKGCRYGNNCKYNHSNPNKKKTKNKKQKKKKKK
eukprot:169991_1